MIILYVRLPDINLAKHMYNVSDIFWLQIYQVLFYLENIAKIIGMGTSEGPRKERKWIKKCPVPAFSELLVNIFDN